MLQFKSANGSRASRRWAKSGKTKTFPRGRRLKVYRASRWSAIGIIGDPAQKTVLDEAGFLMEALTRCLRHLSFHPPFERISDPQIAPPRRKYALRPARLAKTAGQAVDRTESAP